MRGPWYAVRNLMQQLTSAVKYLHDAGVWHRDIKSANTLCGRNQFGGRIVKLADFGLARGATSGVSGRSGGGDSGGGGGEDGVRGVGGGGEGRPRSPEADDDDALIPLRRKSRRLGSAGNLTGLGEHVRRSGSSVGRCRLTVSKQMLKAPLLSALEAIL
jgi:serine/threonine protein kinase